MEKHSLKSTLYVNTIWLGKTLPCFSLLFWIILDCEYLLVKLVKDLRGVWHKKKLKMLQQMFTWKKLNTKVISL